MSNRSTQPSPAAPETMKPIQDETLTKGEGKDQVNDLDLLELVAQRIQQGAEKDRVTPSNENVRKTLVENDALKAQLKTVESARPSLAIPVGVPLEAPVQVPNDDILPGAYAVAPPEGETSSTSAHSSSDRDPHPHEPVTTMEAPVAASQRQRLSVARPVDDNHIPRAEEFDREAPATAQQQRRRRDKRWPTSEGYTALWTIAGVAVTAGLILLIVMVLVDVPLDQVGVPTTAPTTPLVPTAAPTMNRYQYILDLLPTTTVETVRDNPTSPQALAVNWLVEEDAVAWQNQNMEHNFTDFRIVQRFALATFYYATDSPHWDRKDGWLEAGVDECVWHSDFETACHYDEALPGVYADMVLDGNQLRGSLPTEVFLLTKLRVLALPANALTGTIPTELGMLTNLLALNMMQNDMTGPIPAPFLPRTMMMFSLSENQMTGTLPSELGAVAPLFDLNVTSNAFTGPIPSELGTLAGLRKLWLSQNKLTGTIPTELASLPNSSGLEEFMMDGNLLRGEIPWELCSVESIEYDCSDKLCGCNCTCS